MEAEIKNKDLYYKDLILRVSSFIEVKEVFENLAYASAKRHLSAFQRCSSK